MTVAVRRNSMPLPEHVRAGEPWAVQALREGLAAGENWAKELQARVGEPSTGAGKVHGPVVHSPGWQSAGQAVGALEKARRDLDEATSNVAQTRLALGEAVRRHGPDPVKVAEITFQDREWNQAENKGVVRERIRVLWMRSGLFEGVAGFAHATSESNTPPSVTASPGADDYIYWRTPFRFDKDELDGIGSAVDTVFSNDALAALRGEEAVYPYRAELGEFGGAVKAMRRFREARDAMQGAELDQALAFARERPIMRKRQTDLESDMGRIIAADTFKPKLGDWYKVARRSAREGDWLGFVTTEELAAVNHKPSHAGGTKVWAMYWTAEGKPDNSAGTLGVASPRGVDTGGIFNQFSLFTTADHIAALGQSDWYGPVGAWVKAEIERFIAKDREIAEERHAGKARIRTELEQAKRDFEARVKALEGQIKDATFEIEATVTVPGPLLKAAIDSAKRSAAKDDSRPILNGLAFMATESALEVAAADGYRLTLARIPYSGPVAAARWDSRLVLDRDQFKALAGSLSRADVTLAYAHRPVVAAVAPAIEYLKADSSSWYGYRRGRSRPEPTLEYIEDGRVDAADVRVVAGRVERESQAQIMIGDRGFPVTAGSFPDYMKLIPVSFGWVVSLDESEVKKAIGPLKAIAGKGILRIEALSSNQVQFSASKEDADETVKQVIPAVVNGTDPVQIACDYRFFEDAVASLPGKGAFALRGTSPKSPMVFHRAEAPIDVTVVLMPMFVQWSAQAAAAANPLTSGKCDRCRLLYAWRGQPLLRDAHCARCGARLVRTSYELRGYDHTSMRPITEAQKKNPDHADLGTCPYCQKQMTVPARVRRLDCPGCGKSVKVQR